MLLLSLHAISQDNRKKNGKYFTSNRQAQWARTIKPWRYFFQPTAPDSMNTMGPQKLGHLLLWRSSPIASNDGGKALWPRMGFDVYHAKDSIAVKTIAEQMINATACNGPNKGGDYLPAGNFILLNTQQCVSCSNDSGIDYCRHIIKQVLAMAILKNPTHWPAILSAMPIAGEQPNP